MGRRVAAGFGVVVLLAAVVASLLLLLQDDTAPVDPSGAGAARRTTEETTPDTSSPDRRTRPASLGGLVRTETGRPVADQTVRVVAPDGAATEVATDARGWFEARALAPGDGYAVHVDAAGFAPVRVAGIGLRPGEHGDVGVLVLAAGVETTVRVRGPDTRPVAGAQVAAFRLATLRPLLEQPPSVPVATATTRADGTVVFPALAPGAWAFTAAARGSAQGGVSPVQLAARQRQAHVDITLERGFVLRGRVVDTARAPVPGAAVVLIRRGRPSDSTQAPLTRRATADAQGAFRFDDVPGADMVLWAARPGGQFAVANAVRMPLDAEVQVVLGGGGRVEGVVSDGSGAPVEGALVTARVMVLTGFPLELTARADEEGRFAIVAPMDGALAQVDAEKPGHVPATDASVRSATIPLRAGLVHRSTLTLEAGITVRGRVLGPDGPVANAEVFVFEGPTAMLFADVEDDRYSVTLSAGTPWTAVLGGSPALQPAGLPPEAKAYVHGFRGSGEKFNVTSADVPAALRHALPAAPGVLELDIVLEPRDDLGPPVDLSGRVVDGDGNGIGGAKILFSELPHVLSAADGTFEVRNAPRRLLTGLVVFHEDFVSHTLELDPANTEPVVVVLRPRPRVRGRVLDADGNPVAGAYVQRVAATATPIERDWERVDVERAAVGPDGRFDVPYPQPSVLGMTPAPFRIAAGVPGGGAALGRLIEPASEIDGAEVELRLDAGVPLEGSVHDAEGAPLAGAEIVVLPLEPDENPENASFPGALGPPVSGVSGADGAFVIPHLAPGRYRVAARRAGALSDHALVYLPGPGVTFTLEIPLTLSGVARLPDGSGAAGVRVELFGDGENEVTISTLTDSAGAFAFENLRSGSYMLDFETDAGAHVQTREVGPVAAGTTDLVVELQHGLAVTGVLEHADGTPVTNAVVSLQGAGSVDDDEVQVAVEDGRFAFRGLAPGAYDLNLVRIARGHGGERLPDPVRVRAGDQDVLVRLPERSEVRGRLLDPEGRPVAGTHIRLEGAGAAGAFVVQTDTDGDFAVSTYAGARFTFQLPSHPTLVIQDGPTAVCGGPAVEVRASAGVEVRGVVRAVGGQPVEGAYVELISPSGSVQRAARSATDGTFVVAGTLPGERYAVTVTSAGFTPWRGHTDAPATALVVELEHGTTTSGAVVTADGRPVPEAEILLRSTTSGAAGFGRTDRNGHFRLTDLPPGKYLATVTPSGKPAITDLGPFEAGRDDLRVTLPAR